MGLSLDATIRREGLDRKLSGWNRDLLDPKYKRYVVPPMFPNAT
jgi:hypothetical protein